MNYFVTDPCVVNHNLDPPQKNCQDYYQNRKGLSHIPEKVYKMYEASNVL